MNEKEVRCDCGAVIRESDDDVLVATVQEHAHDVHQMELTREEVMAMAERVGNRGAS